MAPSLDPATTVFFRLTIDGTDLGLFNSCDGLGFEVAVETREEGGNNDFVWQLPSRITYSPIRLSRPLTPDTGKVASWATSISSGIMRPTAQIAALRGDGSTVAQWGLVNVLPVRWTGPSFDPNNSAVATETLEIAHHGFTDAGAA